MGSEVSVQWSPKVKFCNPEGPTVYTLVSARAANLRLATIPNNTQEGPNPTCIPDSATAKFKRQEAIANCCWAFNRLGRKEAVLPACLHW